MLFCQYYSIVLLRLLDWFVVCYQLSSYLHGGWYRLNGRGGTARHRLAEDKTESTAFTFLAFKDN
jgi:hypothetical protein